MRNKSLLAVFRLALLIYSLGLISGVSHSGERSLSQLGWQMKEDGRFVRGVEILNVDFFPDGEYLVVRFSLEPR